MWARCKRCDSVIDFRNKRGNKLSNYKCGCGGGYELLYNCTVIGINPISPSETYNYPKDGIGNKWYGLKNKSGDVFYYNRAERKAVIIPNVVIYEPAVQVSDATAAPSSNTDHQHK
jgi:hypothetical protein